MSFSHHPDVSTLMTCSAGSQPEALCAVVVSHISMCGSCREELGRMEQIGVTLFERLPETHAASWNQVLQDLDASIEPAQPPAKAPKHTQISCDVPVPLIGVLGSELDAIAWRELAAGVSQFVVPLTAGAKGDLRLIKLAPGRELPRHGHRGEELTIILRGGYSDDFDTFKRGDFSDLDDDAEHAVKADAKDGCILLIASETRPQFLERFEMVGA